MRFLSLVLSLLIVLNPVWAQTNNGAAPPAEAVVHIHVVEEPGPVRANSTSAKGYIVQVTTPTGSPVASAAVALRLPEQEPTGRFADGLRAWVAYTDAAGIAAFPAIHWSQGAGTSDIRVTVAKGSSHTGLMIAQQIVPERAEAGVLAADKLPVGKTEVTVVVKPEPPALPRIALDTAQTATPNTPLADVVPMEPAKTGAAAHPLKPDLSESNDKKRAPDQPTVSITNSPTGAGNGNRGPELRKKWLVLGALGAAGALGAVLALSGKGAIGAGTPSSSGVTIGGPTVSLGH